MLAKVILYAVLATASLAMVLLLAGFVCLQLGLAGLVGLLYSLAGKIMLLAFGSLMLLGCASVLQAIYNEMAAYGRREASALRRLLRLQMLKQSHSQRVQQEKKQLRYWQEFKRQRMLVANNKKHSRELYQAITTELQSTIAAERYKALQKQLKHYRNQANPEAMLALREQVLCQSSNVG